MSLKIGHILDYNGITNKKEMQIQKCNKKTTKIPLRTAHLNTSLGTVCLHKLKNKNLINETQNLLSATNKYTIVYPHSPTPPHPMFHA